MGKLLDKVVELHKTTDTGIVSAMRNKDSPTAKRLGITDANSWNARNHDTLGGIITSRGFDYIELSSTYDEIGEKGEKIPNEENSYLIWSDSGADVKAFVVEMGKKYDEDSVVFTPAGEAANLIFTNDYDPENPIGTSFPIGTLKVNVESPYKSVLVREPESSFVYTEGEEESPEQPQKDQVVEAYAKAIKSMKLY